MHRQHQDDFCTKMSSNESRLNVSFIVRAEEKFQDTVHKPQLLKREESRNRESNRPLFFFTLTFLYRFSGLVFVRDCL